MGELTVCFQIDTDNRENFPSGIAFQSFRKQRDAFYDIFRVWEENHSIDGWTFPMTLRNKIRTVLTLHNDAMNYYHFARLFKSQLLISCVQKMLQSEAEDDESLSFLKALKCVNPQKLNQLQKRLVTPQSSINQNMEPSFPGVQEFFKDFILFAFNPIFYVHLENCLIHEIMELNDTEFSSSEIEDSETMVDEKTQQNFMTCLCSLRLLAKMLGLVVSIPYKSESELESENSKDLIAQVEVRSKVLPTINLHLCLHNAIVLGKLSLTIPWIAKYLAMLDSASLRLPYYKHVLELMYYIHKAVNNSDLKDLDSDMSKQTSTLLKSTLSWLFDLPNFPKEFYSSWQKTYKIEELKNLMHLDKYCMQKNVFLGDVTVPVASTKCNLDKIDIINEKTMRICCPSVGQVTVINTKKNHKSNKHITPVSSQLLKSVKGVGVKHLELKLEKAFFHGQPASTWKTIDFVSERVASACVKHICNTLLTSSREANISAFEKILKRKQKEKEFVTMGALKAAVEDEMKALATSTSKELKENCESSMLTICESRVIKSIDALLAEDTLAPVKEICVKIATRLASERINQWIQSYIVDLLFLKDLEIEINRFFKDNSQLPSVKEIKHNPNAASPTTIMVNLRELMWDILKNNGNSLVRATVSDILDNLYQTLNERADLVAGPEKVLYFLSIDFALLLLAYVSDLFVRKIQDKFIKIWLMKRWNASDLDSPMCRIFSPRNVMLLAQAEKDDVWPLFGKFIKRLLTKGILDFDSFSDQCVAFFRQDWPLPMLINLSKCLSEAIADFKVSDDAAEKIKYLLGWMAEMCNNMEFPID